jgi:hypothetical protein
MKIKPTNAKKHLRAPLHYIKNIVILLLVHVSTTFVAILREMLYKGYIAKTSRTNAKI